jgi:acyl carrier protein
MPGETAEARVERLVTEYAVNLPEARPLDPGLSLRDDLAIESLTLVSLTLRLADELGVSVDDLDLELGEVKTIKDLVRVAHTLARVTDDETTARRAIQ